MVKKKKTKNELKPKKGEDELTSIRRELELAHKRIDGNSIKRLRWLLNFAYSGDLNNKSHGERINIGWEVVMFGLNKNPKQITTDDVKKFLQDRAEQDADLNFERIPKVSWSLVLGFQESMKLIFEGGVWAYHYPHKEKTIVLPYARSAESESYEWEDMETDQLLLLRAFELVDAEKERLLVCENPKCKLKFVATKKGRSRFHSPTCSAYVRIRKSRGNPV